jgi:hypothetical protein
VSRELEPRFKETDRQIKKTGRQIRELSQNIGGLSNSLGRWVEEMISANLGEKFKALSYTFTHGGRRSTGKMTG